MSYYLDSSHRRWTNPSHRSHSPAVTSAQLYAGIQADAEYSQKTNTEVHWTEPGTSKFFSSPPAFPRGCRTREHLTTGQQLRFSSWRVKNCLKFKTRRLWLRRGFTPARAPQRQIMKRCRVASAFQRLLSLQAANYWGNKICGGRFRLSGVFVQCLSTLS